tara:strand:- start:18 stop:320 length:303 start_codon:yes stop_codon:yes gene_type:complete
MIKHIVFWSFKDYTATGSKADNLSQAVALLDRCANLVAGIEQFEVALGSDNAACTCDLVLNSAFISKDALDAYQQHPDHGPVKVFMKQAVASRHCMDYTF